MARIRTIKPEFPQSESMGRVSREARLTFVLLWTLADDAGRLRGNSRMLASLLFPYDDDAPGLIDGWLAELVREECVTRYLADGGAYVQINNWLDHQKIDKPSNSKIPAFDEASRTFEKPREHSSGDLRTKDQGPKDLDLPAQAPTLEKDETNDRSKRGARLPANWAPSDEDRQFAQEHGLDADEVAARFRDFWISKPGRDGCKLDWSATWRNWCRNDAGSNHRGFGRSGSGGGRAGSLSATAYALMSPEGPPK